MMSLQSSLLGYAIFKALPAKFVHRPLSIKENVGHQYVPRDFRVVGLLKADVCASVI